MLKRTRVKREGKGEVRSTRTRTRRRLEVEIEIKTQLNYSPLYRTSSHAKKITNQEPQKPRTKQPTQPLPPIPFAPPLIHLSNISPSEDKIHHDRRTQQGCENCCCSRVDPSSSFGLVESEMSGEEDLSEGAEKEGVEGCPAEDERDGDDGEVVGFDFWV